MMFPGCLGALKYLSVALVKEQAVNFGCGATNIISKEDFALQLRLLLSVTKLWRLVE